MPSTEAGKRLLERLTEPGDYPWRANMERDIDAIEADAREQEYERLSHVAWSQPIIDAEKVALAEYHRYQRMVAEAVDAERERITREVEALPPMLNGGLIKGVNPFDEGHALISRAAVLAIVNGESTDATR